jgi:opacity protein-like surface antigen
LVAGNNLKKEGEGGLIFLFGFGGISSSITLIRISPMKVVLISSLALVLGACVAAPHDNTHGPQGVSVHMGMDDPIGISPLEDTRNSSTTEDITTTQHSESVYEVGGFSSFGIQYEWFLRENQSMFVGLDFTEYEGLGGPYAQATSGVDAVDAEAVELTMGTRWYFLHLPEMQLQPWVTALGKLGLGLDWTGTDAFGNDVDSDVYLTLGVGAGVSAFLNQNMALEASILYDIPVLTPETSGANGLVAPDNASYIQEDSLGGTSFWLGLTQYF